MFVTKPNGKGAKTVRSLYGEPQHEEAGDGWERGFYGEPNGREAPGPVEFVPEVEPRGRFEGTEEPASRPPESSRGVVSAHGRS